MGAQRLRAPWTYRFVASSPLRGFSAHFRQRQADGGVNAQHVFIDGSESDDLDDGAERPVVAPSYIGGGLTMSDLAGRGYACRSHGLQQASSQSASPCARGRCDRKSGAG